MKRKIDGWGIVITWRYEDGSWNTETITEMPDSVSGQVDDYLTELEKEADKNE